MCFTTWLITIRYSLYSLLVTICYSLYSSLVTMAGHMAPVVPPAPISYMSLPWSFSPNTQSFSGEVREYHDVLEGLVRSASPAREPGYSFTYAELAEAAATSSYASGMGLLMAVWEVGSQVELYLS